MTRFEFPEESEAPPGWILLDEFIRDAGELGAISSAIESRWSEPDAARASWELPLAPLSELRARVQERLRTAVCVSLSVRPGPPLDTLLAWFEPRGRTTIDEPRPVLAEVGLGSMARIQLPARDEVVVIAAHDGEPIWVLTPEADDLRPPIFLYASGDLLAFDTVDAAARYAEPIDVLDAEYVAFDADGRMLQLAVVARPDRAGRPRDSVSIEPGPASPHDETIARNLLTRALAALGQPPGPDQPFAILVEAAGRLCREDPPR